MPIASYRYRLAPRVRDRYGLASRLPIAIRQPRASRPLSLSRLILPELAAHYRIFSPERTTRALNPSVWSLNINNPSGYYMRGSNGQGVNQKSKTRERIEKKSRATGW